MSVKKMSNKEILEKHNVLVTLQNLETKMFNETGKRLLKGRVKIGYAICKNIQSFKTALKPYMQTLGNLEEEYRDLNAEKEALEEARKKGVATIEMIFKDENKKSEFLEKKEELLNLETEVEVYEVALDLLDGIELNSAELDTLMFMIVE